MAGGPDITGGVQRFEMAPDERSRKIDVIGNAESIIFPALLELFEIRTRMIPFDERDFQKAERKRKSEFNDKLLERIVSPIWGILDPPDKFLAKRNDNLHGVALNGVMIESDEGFGRDSSDLQIDSSVVIGDSAVLSLAKRPRITHSLLSGESVLLGENTNTTMFTGYQLGMLGELGAAARSGYNKHVKELLMVLAPLIRSYDIKAYRSRENVKVYQEKFGDMAETASVIDTRYFDILKGLESTDITIDSSLVLGRMGKVLGGEISNSVIASDRYNLVGSHVHLKNTLLVNVDIGHNISASLVRDGMIGSPDAAKAAVEVVKDLPPSPLFSM